MSCLIIVYIPPLNPAAVHCPLAKDTEIAKRIKTTTSETTVIPRKVLVKGPLAFNSFTMAIALAGDLAVMMAPIRRAIPVTHPGDKWSLEKDATLVSNNNLTPPVTNPKVRMDIAATDKKMLLNKSRNSGR